MALNEKVETSREFADTDGNALTISHASSQDLEFSTEIEGIALEIGGEHFLIEYSDIDEFCQVLQSYKPTK